MLYDSSASFRLYGKESKMQQIYSLSNIKKGKRVSAIQQNSSCQDTLYLRPPSDYNGCKHLLRNVRLALQRSKTFSIVLVINNPKNFRC